MKNKSYFAEIDARIQTDDNTQIIATKLVRNSYLLFVVGGWLDYGEIKQYKHHMMLEFRLSISKR